MAISDNASPSVGEVNNLIKSLASKKDEWANLSIDAKIKLLEDMVVATNSYAEQFHKNACATRSLDTNNPDHGQMTAQAWATSLVPWSGWLSETLFVYRTIKKTGKLPPPMEITTRPNGQKACKVGPADTLSWLFAGTPSYEVILDKNVEPNQPRSPTDRPAGLVGILGAGNYDAPIDIITALFIQNKVAIYKTNPVAGTPMTASVRGICQPLIDAGFLTVVDGGADVGKAILDHTEVDEWYVTGSKQTYNAIQFSNPAGPSSPSQAPNSAKPFVAELGGCSPVIIAPDSWGPLDMSYQVGHLSVFTMLNGGHICVRPQAIITCKAWPQREEFLAKLRAQLTALPAWRQFYPGSFDRCAHFLSILKAEGHSEDDILITEAASVRAFGNGTHEDNCGVDLHKVLADDGAIGASRKEKRHPMIFATGLSPDSKALQEEAFCPVLLEVCLDTPAEYNAFMQAASAFSNDVLTGNLTATIVAKDKNHVAVARAVDDLKHGIVGVNVNGVNAIIQPALFWGGGRGSTTHDIQSGMGLFGNLYCLDRPVKALVSAPFFNLALTAQQVTKDGQTQPHKLFKRLGLMLLNRKPGNPFSFLYWSVAVTLGLLGI